MERWSWSSSCAARWSTPSVKRALNRRVALRQLTLQLLPIGLGVLRLVAGDAVYRVVRFDAPLGGLAHLRCRESEQVRVQLCHRLDERRLVGVADQLAVPDPVIDFEPRRRG